MTHGHDISLTDENWALSAFVVPVPRVVRVLDVWVMSGECTVTGNVSSRCLSAGQLWPGACPASPPTPAYAPALICRCR